MKQSNKIHISTKVNAHEAIAWKAWSDPVHITNWNFASSDWCCPKAESDFKVGGKFNYRMESRDGSAGFDYSGSFLKIEPLKLISYVLEDGREVIVTFEKEKEGLIVREEFDPAIDHSIDLQKKGWQAILGNYREYVEKLSRLDRLYFEISINAPTEKVFRIMLDDKTYRKWTEPFHPGSYFRGKWEEGEKILFLGPAENGQEGGMLSKVEKLIPNKVVKLKHYGVFHQGKEITEGPEAAIWSGGVEEYYFEAQRSTTLLRIIVDSNSAYTAYFESVWPKALDVLKELCETN